MDFFVLPLIGIVGGYLISKNKTKSCNDKPPALKLKKIGKEAFTTAGKKVNYLPNTEVPSQNYPVTNVKQLVDTVQEYTNPNTATDKYFDQNMYESMQNANVKVGNTPQQIYSLSGNYVDSKAFVHNNMVPFDGGKIKGYTHNVNLAETILDNMSGSGAQLVKKIEQAPLFKPEKNMNWANGMPNYSDFMQSRVAPGMRNNNAKPFESETVGPGLNQGYTNTGSGGFNSGMEARDKWLPKTVDELRITTNPKLEYDLNGHQGPSYSHITNPGIIGRVEKNQPDRFYVNSQDRWLTTTGAEKGETLRPIQEMGILRRNSSDINYSGPAGNTERGAGYIPQEHEESKRQKTEIQSILSGAAPGKGSNLDYPSSESYTNYNNHRTTVRSVDSFRSGFSGAIGAVVAPLMDILKPSRKEEVSENVRVYGTSGTAVPSNYVNNPFDTTSTTIKETTLYSPSFNISSQKEGNYVNNYKPADLTQRNTTSCENYGGVGRNNMGSMVYDGAYNQTNNDIKSQTIYNTPNMGGTQIFNQHMNINCSKSDSNCLDNRFFTPSSIIPLPPSKEHYGNMGPPQQLNQQIEMQRNTSDILNAFRENPYTHSLTTSV